MKNILIVVGTRPNFIKVTQFKRVVASFPELNIKIVHTGQHYDRKMADIFFEQFNLLPDYYLDITSTTPNSQIAEIMMGLEKLVTGEFKPDLLIAVGDVNSTLATALAANKMEIKLAHLESGLRSNDLTMPEEINRILTDKLADIFFITEQSGYDNLLNEGITQERLVFAGNTMIDSMVAYSPQIDQSDVMEKYNLKKDEFVLMTMHRPATVDNLEGITRLYNLIEYLTQRYKVFFPIHPRTLRRIEEFGLNDKFSANSNIILSEPLDYFGFQKLIKESKLIITDSGGIQEESTFLQKPCLTFRANTERPVTVTEGTNTLIPFDLDLIKELISKIENDTYKKGSVPKLWDGNATQRIVEFIQNIF